MTLISVSITICGGSCVLPPIYRTCAHLSVRHRLFGFRSAAASQLSIELACIMEQDWFPPAQALDHETQERIYLRMAVLQARNQIPRDPRYWHPQREAAWDNSSSTTERFIPAFGVARGFASVAQSEEHIRRPMTPKESYVSARVTGSQRVTPLLSYQSIGWNRRNFEPLPRSSAMRAMTATRRPGRQPFAPGFASLSTSSSSHSLPPIDVLCDPPRISGVGE